MSNSSLSIYPNPASELVNIDIYREEGEGLAEVFIYNDLGQFVNKLESKKSEDKELHLVWNRTDMNGSRLPSGIYLLRIKLDKEAIIKRVIIK